MSGHYITTLPVRLDRPLLELLGFDPFCACGEICSVPMLVGLGLIKLAYQGKGKGNLKHN